MGESKGFKEVVANIKEGEVWENDYLKIYMCGGSICIKSENITIDMKGKFKRSREQYTFLEAFKAYEEGKEIESVESKFKYIDGYSVSKCGEYEQLSPYENVFSINEIRGKWYINDY